MKEELQSKLVEILVQIQEGVSQTKDFAVEQLPDIANQYITFGLWYHTSTQIISLITMLFCFFIPFIFFKKAEKNKYKPWKTSSEYVYRAFDSHLLFFSVVFSIALFIMSFIYFLSNIYSLFLVWTAPKVWLIKEISSLIK